MFSDNDKIHSPTGHTPFYLDNGWHPWKGIEPRVNVSNNLATDFVNRMKQVREEASSALKLAQDQMKWFYNRKRGDAIEYQPGDLVYIENSNIKTDRPAKKLNDKQYGPFKVVKKEGKAAYRIQLPTSWKIHPVINEVLLSRYMPPTFPSQAQPKPPPPLDPIKNRYKVEEILDSWLKYGKLEYKVYWKDFGKEEDTWEPVINVDDATEAIKEFHWKYPSTLWPCPAQLWGLIYVENLTILAHIPKKLYT